MSHQFSQVPHTDIPRSQFNRSHAHKTTFDSGYLVPIYIDEALPGDTFNCQASIFARMATPIVPLMDMLYMDTFFFAVPIRLLWDNWQAFNGEQRNPDDSTDYLIPQVNAPAGGFSTGSLADYYGLPTRVPNLQVSALFFRAYNLIYNEWFRDQNLQNSLEVPLGDGPDDYSLYELKRRCKRHDYFTSGLPWPQKGPGVELPIGGMAPVIRTPSGTHNADKVYANNTGVGLPDGVMQGRSGYLYNTGTSNVYAYIDSQNKDILHTDLSSATAVTINSFRQAFQVQKMLERDARGGTRYTEILRSHFGVVSPDARLQRPEYLGGSSTAININPVQQTSATDNTSPQGNLAAFGLARDMFHGFTKSFTEHTILIGLVNVRADLTYQQGINRMFSRQTRYDFYWPALSHLGEQTVFNKEIYAQGNSEDDNVFNYQERWAEYRHYPSKITGKFRSTDPQPLDIWHLSQKYENPPQFNEEFIEDKPPIDRVIAVPSEPQFIFDSFFSLRCARPMPLYSVPGLIDHF